MRTVLLVGLFLGFLITTGSAAEEIRVVELRHRSAPEVLDMAERMMEGRGTAGAFENKIILKGKAADLLQVETLLQRLDQPRAVLKITVRQQAGKQMIEKQHGAAVRLGTGEPALAADGRIAYYLGNTEQSAEQFLQVLEGESGWIEVGKKIPFTRDLFLIAGRHAGLERYTDYQLISTGFRVRGRLQGDEVILELSPQMVTLDPVGEGRIDFHQLVTTTNIPLGQWYNVAGNLARNDEVSRAFLVLGTGTDREERSVWIRVDR